MQQVDQSRWYLINYNNEAINIREYKHSWVEG